MNEIDWLTQYHKERCAPYAKIVDAYNGVTPALPARLFKNHKLCSVPDSQIFRIVKSSGTLGTQSEIYLDKETAQAQRVALVDILYGYIGKQRRPMIFLDPINERNIAFQVFASRIVEDFEEWHEPGLVVGTTEGAWRLPEGFQFHGSTLIHGGGWKKLGGITEIEFTQKCIVTG